MHFYNIHNVWRNKELLQFQVYAIGEGLRTKGDAFSIAVHASRRPAHQFRMEVAEGIKQAKQDPAQREAVSHGTGHLAYQDTEIDGAADSREQGKQWVWLCRDQRRGKFVGKRGGLSQVQHVYLIWWVLLYSEVVDQGQWLQWQPTQLQADLRGHLLRVPEWDGHLGKLSLFRLQNAHHTSLQALGSVEAVQRRNQGQGQENQAAPGTDNLPQVHELSHANSSLRSSTWHRNMILLVITWSLFLHDFLSSASKHHPCQPLSRHDLATCTQLVSCQLQHQLYLLPTSLHCYHGCKNRTAGGLP